MKLQGKILYHYPTERQYLGNHKWIPPNKVKGEWFPQPLVKLLTRAVHCIECLSSELPKNTLKYTQIEKEIRSINKALKIMRIHYNNEIQ